MIHIASSLSLAQVTTSIIPDTTLPEGNNSIALPSGSRVDISGGHIVGSNLFHSFSDFHIGDGDTANFFSQGTSNILSRVTGNDPSHLFGTIGVDTNFPSTSSANLFFINPNGVVFGPDASLDLNGSFHVSTADYLRLGANLQDGVFYATDPNSDLMTSAPPSAFGFLGDSTSSIAINQSNLGVSSMQSLILVGGDISIGSSNIEARGGTLGFISISSQGEVPMAPELIDLDVFANLGHIDIQDSTIETSGNSAGRVVIRAGQLVFNHADVISNTSGSSNSVATGIDIELTGALLAQNGTNITTNHVGPEKSSDIHIVAGTVTLIDSTMSSHPATGATENSGTVQIRSLENIAITNSSIDTTATTESGSIILEANDALTLSDAILQTTSFSGTNSTLVISGDIELTASKLTLQSSELTTGSLVTSKSGNITLNVDQLTTSPSKTPTNTAESTINFFGIDPAQSTVLNTLSNRGQSGHVVIQGKSGDGSPVPNDIRLIQTDIDTGSSVGEQNGFITIKTDEKLNLIDSKLTALGSPIELTASELVLRSTTLETRAGEQGGRGSELEPVQNAGNLTLNVDQLTADGNGKRFGVGIANALVTGTTRNFLSSAVLSGPPGGGLSPGKAGDIVIQGKAGDGAPVLNNVRLSQTVISTEHFSVGEGGLIRITTDSALELTDTTLLSTVFQGRDLTDQPTGNIELTASTLTLRGSELLAESKGTRNAGNITLNVDELTAEANGLTRSKLSSSGIFIPLERIFPAFRADGIQSGNAGKIVIQGQAGDGSPVRHDIQLTQTDISTFAESLGKGGSIIIDAKENIDLRGASIDAAATGSGGAGTIQLGTVNTKAVRVQEHSVISTEALQASGGAINIEAENLILVTDSRIESSVQGNASSQGGNITLNPEFIVMQNSQILAKAALGSGGEIDLRADAIFIDDVNSLNASAGPAGVDGSINIQAPIQNLSQAIAPLPESIVEVASLYNARCAGQKNGQFSSFSLKGRDRIPFIPGELIPTPLSLSDLTRARIQNPQPLSSRIAQRLQLPKFEPGFGEDLQAFQYRTGCPA